MLLFALAAYVLLQLLIGAYISRRIRTESDYLLAGRSLGPILGTFTIFATWFGAETCLGAAGAIYDRGLSGGYADPFGYALCLLLLGLAFAAPLRRRGLTTLADLHRERFGPRVEQLSILLMIPAPVLWAGAQVRAFGTLLGLYTGFDPAIAIAAATFVVILYTTWGGLLADAWTDLIQGIALLVGLVVLFVAVLGDGGGAVLQATPAERLNPFHDTGFFEGLENWTIPILGSVVSVDLVSRILACKTPGVAQRASLQATGIYITIGMIPALLGLMGTSLVPGLADSEALLPALADQYLGSVMRVLFVGALVSAILSTVDSTLLVAGSLLSHNVIVPLRPQMGEAAKVRAARGSVVLFGLVAGVLAFSSGGVYELVQEASAFGSAGLLVAVAFGLFTRWGGPVAAAASMLTGVTTYVVAGKLLGMPYPFLASLAASVAAYAAGALLEGRGALQTAGGAPPA